MTTEKLKVSLATTTSGRWKVTRAAPTLPKKVVGGRSLASALPKRKNLDPQPHFDPDTLRKNILAMREQFQSEKRSAAASFSVTDWKRRYKAASESQKQAMKRELIASTFNSIRDAHKAKS